MKDTFPDPDQVAETHFIGPDTTRKIVEYFDFPFMLEKHGIVSAGHTHARKGNCFVRNDPLFSQILVCASGEGVILLNGRWHPCSPGTAYITPARARHAYFAAPGKHWEFSWIIYKDTGPENFAEGFSKGQPYEKQVEPELLSFPLQGLYEEATHWQDEIVMQSWIHLANTYVRRALVGDEIDPRLRRLWVQVEDELAHSWDCETMARIANVSEEHLRRLCLQAYSRSPMQRLKWMRIKYASELLLYSNLSIEKIAEEVGYNDAASLTRAFKKSRGLSPAKYRRNIRTQSFEKAAIAS